MHVLIVLSIWLLLCTVVDLVWQAVHDENATKTEFWIGFSSKQQQSSLNHAHPRLDPALAGFDEVRLEFGIWACVHGFVRTLFYESRYQVLVLVRALLRILVSICRDVKRSSFIWLSSIIRLTRSRWNNKKKKDTMSMPSADLANFVLKLKFQGSDGK